MATTSDGKWVGTWASTNAPTEGVAFANQTLRMIARISLGGERFRVRFSNAHGGRKLAIGAAHIALRAAGGAIVPGSDRALTFGGARATAIAAGALVVSDPVALAAAPLADLAISLYLPGEVPETLAITGHANAHQTNYVSPPGDFTAAAEMPRGETSQSWFFLSGIEVMAGPQTGGVVAFGDSLTDANL